MSLKNPFSVEPKFEDAVSNYAKKENLHLFDLRLVVLLGYNNFISSDFSTTIEELANSHTPKIGNVPFSTNEIERIVSYLGSEGLVCKDEFGLAEFEGEKMNCVYLSSKGRFAYESIDMILSGGILK